MTPDKGLSMIELAERCEQASGPDDALDWAIAEAIGCAPGLPYSASLDAAMTLVPEGMIVTLDIYPDHSEAVLRWPYYGDEGEHRAATPALALCAAAIRASSRGDGVSG